MEKHFKRKISTEESSSSKDHIDASLECKRSCLEIDFNNLPTDPAERRKILEYHADDRDTIRRAYMQRGPCQPREHNFPQRKIGNALRRFNPCWFNEFGSWLEYSILKDAAFCLCCYLMKPEFGEQSGDAFITEGFTNWKKKERLQIHVGGHNSGHNQTWRKCEALMNQKQHIEVVIAHQSDQIKRDYRIHLTSIIDCIRFLLPQGLTFRGHDESENSSNQGNFLELLRFLAEHNEVIDKVLQNARGNLKLIALNIQKDIVNAAASETTKTIIEDLDGDYFVILIDESRDISVKEQMSMVLRYVDKKGHIIEHFLSVVHVSDTTAISLKRAMDFLLTKYGLSLSRIRGQDYGGASNMQGEFNGLKSLILKENQCVFYIPCFAHQLQLALVAVAKKHVEIALLFNLVTSLSNVVGASCKRRDILRERQLSKVVEALKSGEISSNRGLNQEITLKRADETRWGSHYGTLLSLINLYSSVVDVLEIIEEDAVSSEQRAEAHTLLNSMQSFEFIFNLYLMKNVLGITNELSQTLQRCDQDIVNAMMLIKISKQRLQLMRDDGWNFLFEEISLLCGNMNVVIPNMDDVFLPQGRSRRKMEKVSNLHHFQVQLFYQVIDMQLQELNDRFTVTNTELLLSIASFSLRDSFAAFDISKLIRFTQFYPFEFSGVELLALDNQFQNYIVDVRSDNEFTDLKGIGDLSKKIVDTRKHIVYHLVYLLLKLALILSVATATVERTFSAMNIIKNRLRNRMGDEWLNDCLVTYIEREVFHCVDNEKIIQRFQNMKTCRGQL